MINTLVEPPIPFAKAAKKYISARGGGSIHPATLHRWRTRGIAGVRLEAIRIGGVWSTTEAAMQRFFAAVTSAQLEVEATNLTAVPQPGAAVKGRSAESERQRRVARELDAVLGVPALAPAPQR